MRTSSHGYYEYIRTYDRERDFDDIKGKIYVVPFSLLEAQSTYCCVSYYIRVRVGRSEGRQVCLYSHIRVSEKGAAYDLYPYINEQQQQQQ